MWLFFRRWVDQLFVFFKKSVGQVALGSYQVSDSMAAERSTLNKMANKTQAVFSQNLLQKSKNNNIVQFTSYNKEPVDFFGSFAEPLCFLALILCVCIIIYGLKYVNGDSQNMPRNSCLPPLPKRRARPRDVNQMSIV